MMYFVHLRLHAGLVRQLEPITLHQTETFTLTFLAKSRSVVRRRSRGISLKDVTVQNTQNRKMNNTSVNTARTWPPNTQPAGE